MSHYLNSNHYGLSPRETDVLSALCHAELSKQTADRLGVCEGVIEEMRGKMYRKLGVRNGIAAICKAFREGLIPLDKGPSFMGREAPCAQPGASLEVSA